MNLDVFAVAVEAVEHGQVAFAGHAKGVGHALGDQALHQEVPGQFGRGQIGEISSGSHAAIVHAPTATSCGVSAALAAVVFAAALDSELRQKPSTSPGW